MADKKTRLSPVELSRVVFGVRYEPQYKIFDYIGELTDKILRGEGTPFGPEVFPQTQSEQYERILLNPEKGHVLHLNQQDAILIWNIDTRNLEEVQTVADQFEEWILDPLREDISLSNVVRYGCMFRLARQTGLKNPPISHYVAKDFPGSNLTAMSMRFTRRLPTSEAMWRKDVEDFRNLIYMVEESEKGDVQITLDYQQYFKPFLDNDDWGKYPFKTFVDQALTFFEEDGFKWLKGFSDEAAVA